MTNNVANAEASIMGSAIPLNAWPIELKPDVHVTISDVRSGAFRKCTAAKITETAKIAVYFRPVLSKRPKTIPRKKASSMNGTAIDAKSILPKRGQAKLCRNAQMRREMSRIEQQSRGSTE